MQQWQLEAEAWCDGLVQRTGDVSWRLRPWSSVMEVPTADGSVWFKAACAATRFEIGIYDVLPSVVPERVLAPLALDLERGWVLLPDGGTVLGDRLPEADAIRAMVPTLAVYGELQRALAPHAGELLAVGVADMSPAAMPGRFEEMLEATGRLLRDDADRAAHRAVTAMRAEYSYWCAELAASPLPATLDHNDLHPWNVLDGPRWFDWGDAVLAHPFAAMLVALKVVRSVLGEDVAATAADAYLDGFGGDRATLELACRVGKVARCLVWERALQAARDQGTEVDDQWLRAPVEWMRMLLHASHLGDED